MGTRSFTSKKDFGKITNKVHVTLPEEWAKQIAALEKQVGELSAEQDQLHARLDEYSRSFSVLINVNWTWFAAAKALTTKDIAQFNTQRKRDAAFGLIAKANQFDQAQVEQLRPVFNEICDAAKVIVDK